MVPAQLQQGMRSGWLMQQLKHPAIPMALAEVLNNLSSHIL